MLSSIGGNEQGAPREEIIISNCGIIDRAIQPAATLAAKDGLASFLQFKLNHMEKGSSTHNDTNKAATAALTRANSVIEETK